MSVSSFPRPEHIALLRSRIEEGLDKRGLRLLEVAERGLNQMKCQYRFGLRRRPDEKPSYTPSESVNDAANDWAEMPIHFQIAQRLEEGRGDAEWDRMLERFLSHHFPEFSVPHDGG